MIDAVDNVVGSGRAFKFWRFHRLEFEKSICELLIDDDVRLKFERIELQFEGVVYTDVFGAKNNKTLKETLKHRRYSKLYPSILSHYEPRLDTPLGEFLLQLKCEGDPLYRQFLNNFGDLSYSNFVISSEKFFSEKGVYAYYVGGDLMYIGRCKDSIKKRVNQGYGKIHPKNCYIDGQSTNCRLNALITKFGRNVSLWFHVMSSNDKIVLTEQQLVRRYDPPWNIQQA